MILAGRLSKSGGSRRGGGAPRGQDFPPTLFGEPPNFIKRDKNVTCVPEYFASPYLTVNRTPPFKNPVSAPDLH